LSDLSLTLATLACLFAVMVWDKFKMHRTAAFLACVLIGSSAYAQTKPVPIFSCHVAGKVAQVVRANGAFVYRYGKPGATPEIEIRSTGHDGRLVLATAPAQRQLFKQLRFNNGGVEYLLYDWQIAGLAVVRNGRDLSDKPCALKSDGFSLSVSELSDLIAEDPEEPTIR